MLPNEPLEKDREVCCSQKGGAVQSGDRDNLAVGCIGTHSRDLEDGERMSLPVPSGCSSALWKSPPTRSPHHPRCSGSPSPSLCLFRLPLCLWLRLSHSGPSGVPFDGDREQGCGWEEKVRGLEGGGLLPESRLPFTCLWLKIGRAHV